MGLSRRFYCRDALQVAPALLGKRLVRTTDRGERISGFIVEVEAYLGEHDKAAHSFGRKRTARNAAMYLPGGHAYVYFIYGMHWCFNVVAGQAEHPIACLVRAVQPEEGLDIMRQHRGGKISSRQLQDTDLCSGPAKLCQAFAINGELNAVNLTQGATLWIEAGRRIRPAQIMRSPRIGIDYAEEWKDEPLRFSLRENPYVSR